MASAPVYASTPKLGIKRWAVANTNRDGTGTIQTVATCGASGSRLESLTVKGDGDLNNSVVCIFVSDDGGTTWYLFDEFDVGDPAAGSTTVASYREIRSYQGMGLPANMKIGATLTVAPTSGNVLVFAELADL